MRGRRFGWMHATVVALAALANAGAAAPGERTIEYLYVDSNEGGSSGGHVALRFDDSIYHFQHQAPGVLRLYRDDDRHFFELYRGIMNRTVRGSRVAVSEDTYSLLRDAFESRRQAEEAWFDRLAAYGEDAALYDRLLAARAAPAETPPLALPAAGFFLPDGGAPVRRSGDAASADPALVALRARVAETYGPDFLAQRASRLEAALTGLSPADAGASPPVDPEEQPPAEYSFARHYEDLLLGLRAIQVVEAAPPLREGSLREGLPLTPSEEQRVAAYAADLEERLVHAVRSQRPDFGFPLLVGMARLIALHESLRTHRLVVVDAFGARHDLVTRAQLERNRALWPEMRTQNEAALELARASFFDAAAPGEPELSRLESAANRWLELEEALRGQRDVRANSGRLVPDRPALRTDLVQPGAPDEALREARDGAREHERTLAQNLERVYAYDLITRNCVSEIFRLVDRALAASGGSEERLGGHVSLDATLNFIPFVSAGAVDHRWRVVERTELPSHRRELLDEMYANEGVVGVYLREFNTVTSTAYQHPQRDSVFLLFTDDAIVARPLFGTVNLVTGLVTTAAGLLAAPFDGGDTLSAGARGVLFSLPELAFFNIRKGTFEHVPEPPGVLDVAR